VSITDLPAINAALNATSAILVGLGLYFIHRKNIRAHKACMITALFVSALFLTCYLVYHYHVGSVRFAKQGWLRSVYFPLLVSHTILAVVIVPMVLRTVYLAFTNRFREHTRIARWTFPLWMYVSVTGVVVYLMLYQL
jgi:uncharacterized membrane protein YozB (DUF420 family)